MEFACDCVREAKSKMMFENRFSGLYNGFFVDHEIVKKTV